MITWIILRAAGIAAYVMLFASVAWGLAATTSVFGRRVAKATAVAVHQFLSTVALVFLGIHLGGLLVDRFMPFSPLDVLVPLRASFRPVAVAFGIVAMYAMVTVLVSSWLRKRLGTTWWRRLHLLAAPTFILSMVHGIFAGTDSARPWMWWIYVTTGSVLLFLVVLRGLTAGFRPARAERPATARRQTSTAQEAAPADSTLETAPFNVPAGAPANGKRAVANGKLTAAQVDPAPRAGRIVQSHDRARDLVIRLEVRVDVGDDGIARPVAVRRAEDPPAQEPPALEPATENGHGRSGDRGA